jgi:hypothetical protein
VHPRRIPDHKLLDAIGITSTLVDGPLTSVAYHQHRPPGAPSVSTITARFGSWADALETAGLAPTGRRRPRRWKPAEILAAVDRWIETADDTRYPAYLAAAADDPELPLAGMIERHFGGWRRLLDELYGR